MNAAQTFDTTAIRREALAALNSEQPDDAVGTTLARLLGLALDAFDVLKSERVEDREKIARAAVMAILSDNDGACEIADLEGHSAETIADNIRIAHNHRAREVERLKSLAREGWEAARNLAIHHGEIDVGDRSITAFDEIDGDPS